MKTQKVVWIPLAKRQPPKNEPYFLVTNNLTSRNAKGHRSHVWLVPMIHEHKSGDKTLFDEEAVQVYGRFSAFNEHDMRIIGLTHWASLREYFL